MRNREEEEVKFWNGISVGGKPAAGLFNQQVFSQRIKSLFGSSIVLYYKLDELTGTTATDISGNGRDGTYQGTYTLGGATSKTGRPCVSFAGAGDVNAQPVLTSTFTPNDFTILALMNNTNYESAGDEYLAQITGDANNFLSIFKNGAGIIKFGLKTAGASPTPSYYDSAMATTNGWTLIGAKFKNGSDFALFLNGCKFNISTTGTLPPAEWAASGLTAARIGALNGSYGNGWRGGLSDFIVLNRAISDAEMRQAYKALVSPVIISVLGDSISARTAVNWTSYIQAQYNNQNVGFVNHAVGAATIASDFAGQVTAAANDDADKIIIHIGTNDNNAGDMGALQTTLEAGIVALKASNPRAEIDVMGVLKRWANNTDGAEVDKGNIRTMEIAAAAAQSVTYWDTYTSPWVAQNQMALDGTHPTSAAGHPAIATNILPLL